MPPDQSQESNRGLDEILKLDSLVGGDGLMGILSAPLQKLRYVYQQIRLYNGQGPDDNGLPGAFLDATQIAIAHGDLARAQICVERAVLGWIILEGDDSPNVLQYKATLTLRIQKGSFEEVLPCSLLVAAIVIEGRQQMKPMGSTKTPRESCLSKL